MPDGKLHLISDEYYQSLSDEGKKIYMDGRNITSYDPQTSIPKEVAVYIAAGYYLKYVRLGGAIKLTNEFVPQGLITDPFIALNANFYHEVFGHALLRSIDYRKLDDKEIAEEEREAQFREIEWVKNIISSEYPLYVDKLFLVPS